jgi:hypothetical protein
MLAQGARLGVATLRVGGEGFAATVAAADEGVDFVIRKNEAIFGL